MCTDGEVDLPEAFALLVNDVQGRVLRLVPGLDDDLVPVDRNLIGDLFTVGDSVDEVLEAYDTALFDDGDGIVGIPFADEFAFLDLVTVMLVKH